MASLELRTGPTGSIWHLRYRVRGVLKSETTRCSDKREAQKYLENRMRELPDIAFMRVGRHRDPDRNPGVYFIYSHATKLTKIGHSRHMQERVKALTTVNADRLEVIAAIPTSAPRRVEARLHQELAEFRKHGEWFDLEGLRLAKAIGRASALACANARANTIVALRREMPSIELDRVQICQ